MSVSIQQAAANAFATWLATKLPGVAVEPRWPSPDKQKPSKSVTLVMAGPRLDTPIEPRMLSATNTGATQTTAVWQIKACSQPFQLDIWTTRESERDDLIARLDQCLSAGASSLAGAFNPNPFGHGALIAVQDGWEDFDTIADFDFEEPDTDNDADTSDRAIYRATYRGNAHFKLTVTTVTARQLAINFVQRLSETDAPSDFP